MNPFLETLKVPRFQFKCFACAGAFTVHFKYMKEKSGVECPSCGQRVDKDAFESLKIAVDSLEKASKALFIPQDPEGGLSSLFQKEGFKFRIDWENEHPTESGGGGFSE